MTKQSLFQLLADNQIETVFQQLKTNNSKYINDLVLLESQWSELRTRERNGTISLEQANLEVARIRKNLLDLIEQSFNAKASFQQPVQRPAATTNLKWAILAVIMVALIVAIVAFFPESQGKTKFAESSSVQSPQSAALSARESNPKSKDHNTQVRTLEVPPNNIVLNKGRIGDITFKFLSAELSEQNLDNWVLRIKARVIKPAYGAHVGSTMLHIAYGDFEKIPVHIDFPGLGPNETADGVMEFEIPKSYHEAKVLIYHYPDEPPIASIPFKW
jgi:hypothetical protein